MSNSDGITRQQKIEMFTMHLDGHTLKKIAEKFGVTRMCVRQILYPDPNIPYRESVERIIYPGLRDYMLSNGYSIKRLAFRSGVDYSALLKSLVGKSKMSQKTANKIVEATGLTLEQIYHSKKETEDEYEILP